MGTVYEIHHGITTETALDITEITTNTTVNGETIDRNGFEALEFTFLSGTLTDGTYAIKLQHGAASDGSDMADITDEALVLGSADFASTEDDITKRLGYIGKERYVRAVVTSTSVTSGGTLSATAVLAHAKHKPTED